MAELLETQPDTKELDLNALEVQDTPEETQEAEAAPELPDKYRGKSLEEVVRMHQEAESVIGRQGQEVGELRKLADSIIQQQTVQTETTSQAEELDDADFLASPKQAVEQLVANHPDVIAARQAAKEATKASTLAKLEAKHPDMKQIAGMPEFKQYVASSPMRMEMLRRADKELDFEAADELFVGFKERQGSAQAVVSAEKNARKANAKVASDGGSGGTGNAEAKPIYRRSQLMKLMNQDPEKYEAMQPQIMAAYAEGRVR